MLQFTRSALLASASLTLASTAMAATLTWDGGGDGIHWSSAPNWNPDATPANGDVFILPSSVTPVATTLDIASLRQASLTLNSTAGSGWTINGSDTLQIIRGGSSTTVLTSTGASQNTINPNVQFINADGTNATADTRISVGAGNVLKFNGNVTTNNTGNAQFRVIGGGTAWIAGAFTASQSSTTDSVYILDSTLRLDGPVSLNTTASNGVGLEGSATLIWNSSTDLSTHNRVVLRNAPGDKMIVLNQTLSKGLGTGANQFAFTGTGSTGSLGFSIMGGTPRDIAWASAMTWNTAEAGNNGVMRQATLRLNTHALADARVRWTSGLSIARNGTLRTIEVGNVTSLAIDAEISGAITNGTGATATDLRKTGAGTLLLSGNNTFSDTYTIQAGTLLVTGTNAAAATVQSGGTLGGTGSFAGAVTVNNGGTLAPGLSPGTLTVNNNLVLADLANLDWELGAPWQFNGSNYPSPNDLVRVNGNLTLDGQLAVTALSGFGVGTYTLLTYTGTLTNNTLNIASLPPGYVASIDIDTVNKAVNLVVIPEPGTLVLAAAGLLMMLSRVRRT